MAEERDQQAPMVATYTPDDYPTPTRGQATRWALTTPDEEAVGTLIFVDDPKVDDKEYSYSNPSQQATQANYQAEYDLSAWSAAIEFSKAF